MMVFLTTKSCRILYSEASEQPHRCSSHSNTLLTHMLHARSHWFLSAPGLVCCSSTLHSQSLLPQHDATRSPCSRWAKEVCRVQSQGLEDSAEGEGRKKTTTSKASARMKNKPPRGDAACPRLST